MRKGILLLLAFVLSLPSRSAVVPMATEIPANSHAAIVLPNSTSKTLLSKKTSALKRFTARMQQKMQLWMLKHLTPKKPGKEGSKDLAQTAMILSIIGLAAILIPYINIASIPLAILGLVFGYKALRENPNSRKAKTAVILGWVTIGLWVLIGMLVLLFISALVI